MSKKFGLGKGLGALIPEEIEKKEIKEDKKDSLMIPLNKIKTYSEQPRKFFDNENIAELAESIKNHGIIQPILLRKNKSNYIIVAGERRFRAAKMLGLKEVPAIIKDLTENEVLEISLIENIQREDLNPIEEAIAYKNLLQEFNLTQQELSSRIGKSRVAITNTMRLLKLDERVQQYLIENVISEAHGRVLLSLENNDLQYEFAQKVIDNKLSVRDLERSIKLFLENSNKPKKESKVVNPYVKDVQNKLQDYFGTKVIIDDKNQKGKIAIEYYSEEDLNRILELINI
ncbi:ParB/RepB/Spo0J family partition protein [Clostridium thermobutyricum]|uniref:Putative chromosome-partitioning protein ParB n=1 Tax=Clostridium thermobutyricum DSM 4928 TaxID=1121339 RepID=A0A1V4SLP8_9CLOT|nr:ParB/RepB/Spo0J family partition protein [Clostridium thermobutyricum]OPX44734.1 putative chromosome-partitioning protein ParB [Clostridium thermobutyricum DSM 4928]